MHALGHLKRDLESVLITDRTTSPAHTLELQYDKALDPETYTLFAKETALTLKASDDLGFIYGIYEISRRFLGIKPFWFWNDQEIIPVESISVPEGFSYRSPKPGIRYRGWFINDEVLLDAWQVDGNSEKPWEMAFEALLRLGGNMTVPGTDKNSRKYRKLASKMGLYITHHHAEPLGAEMFIRAFPDLEPSFDIHRDLFIHLWKEAIEEQKDSRVIWNLGFRGQGDKPFWADDPRYDTPKARGRLMSEVIRLQYDLVRDHDTDAVCCTNLYGEIMELYRGGFLELPEDVIRIWADNGYGKMVSRRQNDNDPRVYALPKEGDGGRHGIYYHVSFYDLQAANHMTMMPVSPAFVRRELEDAVSHGAQDFWIINCSNIKPHVYYLDLVADLWRSKAGEPGSADVSAHLKKYVSEYYGPENAEAIGSLFSKWPECSVKYGPYEDNRAGEQFANHITRILATNFVADRSRPAPSLKWATDAADFKGQITWYHDLVREAAGRYGEYLASCRETADKVKEPAKTLLMDSLVMQAEYMYYGYLGATRACESMLLGLAGDYKNAFYKAGLAREAFLKGNEAMRSREHDKWQGFYENDCEADIKQSAYVMEYLMSTLRALGDGPHYYGWQREFQESEGDSKVFLLLNTTNHLKDPELFDLMKERFQS
jgi:hypothetical protein